MRLEWLEDILAVAQTGSFSEAAERRRLTQSAFSRRIQNIEEYVGVELFDRSHKPVQLHPATEAQRERIQTLAGQIHRLIEELRRGERQTRNRVVIASQHALTASYTPALVRDIQACGPEIYMRLRSANLDECFGLLLSKQADLALIYRLEGEGSGIEADYVETISVDADRLVPVASPGVAAGILAAGAGDLPTVAYPAEVYFGQIHERAIAPRIPAAFTPVPRVETALTLAAVELAAAGVGVAWVPRSLVMRGAPGGSLVELGDVLPSVALVVTAVRLSGGSGPAESAIWSLLQARAHRTA